MNRPVLALGLLACGMAPAAEPTFNRDVAPILHGHCSGCHRPGESAPFDLLTFEDARRRARQIGEVVASGFMPPWLPEPGHEPFRGARRLDDAVRATLLDWIAAGTPEGDPPAPTPPTWTAGWQQGPPDLLIEPDREFVLPADGLDVFRNLVIPIPTERTRYVRMVDLQPGNPRVVHHAVMRIDRSRSARLMDAQDPLPGYPGMEWGEARQPEGRFLGWTPGRVAHGASEEFAWRLDPGSDLVVQLHMVPSGKSETIRPRIGFYFAEKPPVKETRILVLDEQDIDIPPGVRDYTVEESYRIPVDLELLSVYPHAHYLGKQLDGWAEFPDGEKHWLIRIPDWDFNWQDQYYFERPVKIPAGSTLHMRYVYDNSESNPRNPNQPAQRVRSGNRSVDEMGSMSFEVLLDDVRDWTVVEESIYRQEIEQRPDSWMYNGLLGTLLLNDGRLDEARRHLERALDSNPGDAVCYNQLGVILARQGDPAGAQQLYRRALQLRPLYADAHYNLGVLLAAEGAAEQALRHYLDARKVRDHDAELENNLGVTLAQLGRTEEAMEHFRRVLQLDPDSAEGHGNLGNLLFEGNRVGDAVAHYRRGLALRDSDDLRYNLQAAVDLLEDVESDIRQLESAVAGRSADLRSLVQLTDLYAMAGRYDEALALARQILALARGNADGERAMSERVRRFERALDERGRLGE